MNDPRSILGTLFPARSMNTLRFLLLSALSVPAMALAGGIRFEGNTAVSSNALGLVAVRLSDTDGQLSPDPAGAVYRLGQLDASRLSADGVAQVVRAISQLYQDQGILATRAQVTRQAFEAAQQGEDLVVEVIEGRVGSVRVVGADDGTISDATRERVLAASPVQVGGAIDGDALEHSLAALNRFSASRVQPVLFAEPEGLVLQYRVKPEASWNFGYTIDNFGSERTGEVRHSLSAGMVGVATSDDRLSISGILTSTSESRYLRGEYFVPFGATLEHRLRLSAYYASYTAESVGNTAFDYEGESIGAILAYEYTLWSGGNRFLDLTLGAHAMNAEQDQSSVTNQPATDSGFFLPFIDLKLSQQGVGLSWVAGARLETNMPGLGGTSEALELNGLGRYEVVDSFTIARLYGGVRAFFDSERVHELLVNAAYIGVLGSDRLPAPFLNVVGGHNTVRGYRVAMLSGDRSGYAQLEYRYHLLRQIDQNPDWDAALAAFYDLGAVENESPLIYEFDDTIAGFGVGLHVSFRDRFRASVEYAQAANDVTVPLTSDSVESGDSEVYVKASIQF